MVIAFSIVAIVDVVVVVVGVVVGDDDYSEGGGIKSKPGNAASVGSSASCSSREAAPQDPSNIDRVYNYITNMITSIHVK
jgi:hypothetical protein